MTGYNLCNVYAKEFSYIDYDGVYGYRGQAFPALNISVYFTRGFYVGDYSNIKVSYHLIFEDDYGTDSLTVDSSYSMYMNNIEVENVFKGTSSPPAFIDALKSFYLDLKKMPDRHFFRSGLNSDYVFEDHPFSIGSNYYPPNRKGRFRIKAVELEFDSRPPFYMALYNYSQYKKDHETGYLAYAQDSMLSNCCFRCEASYLPNIPDNVFYNGYGSSHVPKYPFKPEYFGCFMGVRFPLQADIVYIPSDYEFHSNMVRYVGKSSLNFTLFDSSGVYSMPFKVSFSSLSFLDAFYQHYKNSGSDSFYHFRVMLDSARISIMDNYYTNDHDFLFAVKEVLSAEFGNSNFSVELVNSTEKGFLVSKTAPTSFFRPVHNSYINSNTLKG